MRKLFSSKSKAPSVSEAGSRGRVREIPIFETGMDPADLDPGRYLRANSDVAAAGADARLHYEAFGRSEGRRQIADLTQVMQIREEKLSRIKFRGRPHVAAAPGVAVDYLPESIRQSFEIPEFPPVAENGYTDDIISEIRADPQRMFLDVGAGSQRIYYENVVCTDIWAAPCTDVVCVGEELPFADAQFDYIFCLAVLEHTKRPWVAIEEMLRVLKPGGHVRIDWPFLQGVHGYPHHYYNATPKGAVSQFEDQCDILWSETMLWQHPVFTLDNVLGEWRAGLPTELQYDFDRLTVGEILAHSTVEKLGWPVVANVSADKMRNVGAGTTFVARKR
jgi:SAM-dependent methyltransferase